MFDELTCVNDDVSQTFDADFGGSYVNRVLDDGTIIGRSAMLGGHADADQLDDDQRNALAEIEADRAIQAADDAHRNELAAAHAAVKPFLAGHQLRISRTITIDDLLGRTVLTCGWIAMIDMTYVGQGTSAREAAEAALAAWKEACVKAQPAA